MAQAESDDPTKRPRVSLSIIDDLDRAIDDLPNVRPEYLRFEEKVELVLEKYEGLNSQQQQPRPDPTSPGFRR